MAERNYQAELDVLPLISKEIITVGSEQRNLKCPTCGGEFNHPEPPYLKDGNDAYEANWGGRGDLIVVPMWGECGSRWQLCVGFHKGNAPVFARVIKSCSDETK
ncbi:hypothetical protein DET61_11618 [Marinobacter nauticus]|jgi:uncharacterized Zn-finger protein|uniref:Uncharacterized protein n=1 Tax=Marinobacter nauticus TaxID=2743 RepID=A0A368XC05_MARNT|nr:hypothetical protein [Marinobacter nauticus]RCW63977.1 hypothetical protein DET61_11618 [Marinobacter nauticus]|tara:strand:+ start:205 stop:516 length:312 start_codon:yes stop_codon:yes gene_type:complete